MRIALLRLSAIGDVVQSLGAMRGLARAVPDVELYPCVQRECAPLLDGLDEFAGVIEHDRRGGVLGYWRTARALRRLRLDAILELQGNWKSAGLARASGASERIGALQRRERSSGWLLDRKVDTTAAIHDAVPRGAAPRHPAVVALAVVRAIAPSAAPVRSPLVASDREIDREAVAVRALGIDPGSPFRVIVAGGSDDPRALRPERVDGGSLIVVGPDEQPDASDLPVLRHARGELRRLVGLGGLIARAGGEVVGPDRGPTHVLIGAGAEATVLHGPRHPARTAPPAGRVLVHASPPECAPCERRTCSHPDGPVCMAFGLADGVEWSAGSGAFPPAGL